jgi:phage N-6-adenine-methyltransferase
VVTHAVHFRSERSDWRTPRAVFDGLHREFDFTIDVCATPESALLPRFFTEADEALLRSWEGERAFCNPPYGRVISRWMEKVYTEAPSAELIVALVPSRTDTAWWHDYATRADEIRFLRGRLEFEGVAKGNPQSHNAPFPSCVLVYR